MISPTRQFASTPELLRYLGRIVINRESLRNLCLTSKSFYASFIPFLYAEVWIRASNAHFLVEDLHRLLNNNSLKYTNKLDIAIPRHSRRNTGHTEGALSELYNKGVQALLASMPELTHFSWEDATLYMTTISTLHEKCLKLRSLIIHNEDHIEERLGLMDDFDFDDGFRERRELFATQDLSLFSNLDELEIYGIYGDLISARRDLVHVLIKSPKLRTLGLSISADTVERLSFEGTVAKNIEYLLFLKELCDEYVTAGGKPLRIHNLVLGLSLIVWQPGRFLADLIDHGSLEYVYISNQGHDVAINFQEEEDNIAWNLFTPDRCPNLSAFGVHIITKSVGRWVASLQQGYIRQFRTEWSTATELNGIVAKLENSQILSQMRLSLVTARIDDFQFVKLQSVQAFHINVDISTPREQSNFLEWIQRSSVLKQLSLNNSSINSKQNKPAEDEFEYQVAAVCKCLRYMVLNNVAWRIWREEEVGFENGIRFERLDRFESRALEVFQPWSVFKTNQ